MSGRIVITGALGHIGSRLIRELAGECGNAEILLLDNLWTQRYCSLFGLPNGARYRFVESDIRDADLKAAFRGAGVVVHLAAVTNATASFELQEEVEKVNVKGTERVAEACAENGARMIFVSTTSVYGSQEERVDEECPTSALQPQSPYAESKLRGETYLRTKGAAMGLAFVIFRFGTIFGPSTGMRFDTAVNKFCWQAVNGVPLTVWRTALDQKRPYLDLTDAVGAIRFAIQRKLFDGRVYNVVTTNRSVRDVVAAIRKHVPDVQIQHVDTRIMNQLSYEVSSERLARAGFEPCGDLETGIEETIRWLGALCTTSGPRAEMSGERGDQ